MVTDGLTAGKEIDCQCTRCRMPLRHTIVAMVADTPCRVKCNTCGSEHRFIAPRGDGSGACRKATAVVRRRQDGHECAVRVAGAEEEARPRTGRARAARVSRDAGAPPARRGANTLTPEVQYARLLRGKEDREILPYSARQLFDVNDRVEHPSLGPGIVLRVRDDKVEIFFAKVGARTLVHGR